MTMNAAWRSLEEVILRPIGSPQMGLQQAVQSCVPIFITKPSMYGDG